MEKIFLDLGHGGNDPGAVYKNLVERDINLVMGFACKEELERHGVEVKVSRTTNSENPSLSARCDMANQWGAKYFISIHNNAGGGDRGEVIHSIYRGKGLELANAIAGEMKAAGQSVVKEYDKKGSDGTDYFAVIRQTKMDAVIVEGAFLDNEIDNDIIDTPAEQKSMGGAIARGILKQLGIAYKPIVVAPSAPVDSSVFYRVCAGSYNDKANAEKLVTELKSKGYSAFIAVYER